MQIRTPKKYQGAQRRSIISCRRLTFYAVMLLLIAAGIGVYLNRQVFAPIVQDAVDEMILDLEGRAATLAAPAPTPTTDPTNKLIEGNNYWMQGALNEALDTYLEILDALPNESAIFDRIAVGLISLGRIDESLAYAERAIHADPYSADAWAVRAWALDWAGRAGEAVSSAFHALELDPESSRAQAYLAEAYRSLGQIDRAETLVEDILEEDPDSHEAYRARGLIKWLNRVDFEGAVQDFQTAFDIADNMNFILIDIATIESSPSVGNYDAALEMLEAVVEVNPRNTRALFRLGDIYNGQFGDPSQARGYLQDCVDFDPANINCHYLLGRVQYRLELHQDAADSFEQTMRLGSEIPRHYYWAGWSQINIGNCTRAMTYLVPGYQLALEQDDPDAEAFETVMPQCRQSLDSLDDPTAEAVES